MEETTTCNVCDSPGSVEDAIDIARVRSNVRKFGTEFFTVWRCSNCRSLHSREAIDIAPYYVDYPMRNQKRDFATEKAFDSRLKLLTRHGFSRKHTLLDYGCGHGLFVSYLRDKGFQATGYDPYVPALSERGILSHQYDFVTSADVIEHVAEPREEILQYKRLLKSGGTLVIGTPNAGEIALRQAEKYSMELHQPYHRHLMSETALIAMGKSQGLNFVGISRRFYHDTLYPMVNTQFVRHYLLSLDGFLDSGFEEPKPAVVISSPKLLFLGIFGYFFRAKGNMQMVFTA